MIIFIILEVVYRRLQNQCGLNLNNLPENLNSLSQGDFLPTELKLIPNSYAEP
ncbi:MAG: hypothetical protein QXM93_02790 [Candidatus Methanomethyliaceae archaeon]